MRILTSYIPILFLILGILHSCSKKDEDTVDLGYDYYPVEAGNYIKYHVREVIYDDFGDSTYTLEYKLMEILDSGYIDLAGNTSYNLYRYRDDLGDSVVIWKLTDVYKVSKDKERAIRTEENVNYVKLSFPLRRSKTWDGNSRNDSASQIYSVVDYDLRNELDSATFQRTCRVNQWKNKNLIEDQLQEDVYARGVGLVDRIDRKISIDPSDSSKAGYEIHWIYLEHGKQ